MNAKEFCFIICTNNDLYCEECIFYINNLMIPDGYTTDIITIREAASLTSAYNYAMKAASAKYKIYLHHDTFIINPRFLYDILDIFNEDASIGMIGMVGAPKLPESCIMWETDRYGALIETHLSETVKVCANPPGKFIPVEVIDGFIMITRYDIPWREDIFDKWDFYDCSQSVEFHKAGYTVVVPYQENPWCHHDCGYVTSQNYDSERLKFKQTYNL